MAAAFFTWLKNFKASTKSRGYAAIDAQTLAAITPCLDYFITPISNNKFRSSWKFDEVVIKNILPGFVLDTRWETKLGSGASEVITVITNKDCVDYFTLHMCNCGAY